MSLIITVPLIVALLNVGKGGSQSQWIAKPASDKELKLHDLPTCSKVLTRLLEGKGSVIAEKSWRPKSGSEEGRTLFRYVFTQNDEMVAEIIVVPLKRSEPLSHIADHVHEFFPNGVYHEWKRDFTGSMKLTGMTFISRGKPAKPPQRLSLHLFVKENHALASESGEKKLCDLFLVKLSPGHK